MAITLVLGGARSGKSAYAQREAERLAQHRNELSLVFVATAEAGDEEMSARILRHQADRDLRWRTIEAPRQLADAIEQLSTAEVAVIDCLTLWLSNEMLAGHAVELGNAHLLQAIRSCRAELFIVSNEVGLGIVPDNALARDFRDRAGRLNQLIAEAADAVVFVAAGLPLQLKP